MIIGLIKHIVFEELITVHQICVRQSTYVIYVSLYTQRHG
jgi:hypothetical protein